MVGLLLQAAALCLAAENLVQNGGFEAIDPAGQPVGWAVYGRPGWVQQTLSLDVGRAGGHSARLECTGFRGGFADCHAMLAQIGKVAVEAGHWYHLSFWAKAEHIRGRSVLVGLMDTQGWELCGLYRPFRPIREFRRFQFLFQATRSIAATSRLHFAFLETGTLWVDDVELTATAPPEPQYHPTLAVEGRTNLLPNSSFEVGASGWGGYTIGLPGWGDNLNELWGEVVAGEALHGSHSLCIPYLPDHTPAFFSAYVEPLQLPVQAPLAANAGWIPVQRGQRYTLSAFLKADREGVNALLLVRQGGVSERSQSVSLSTDWQRYTFTFPAESNFCGVAVGLDRRDVPQTPARVWVDALQLEKGETASPYQPRDPVEVGIALSDSPTRGLPPATRSFPSRSADALYIISIPTRGPRPKRDLLLAAVNHTDAQQAVSGQIILTDFFETVRLKRTFRWILTPHSLKTHRQGIWPRELSVRKGFFRVRMSVKIAGRTDERTLRLAFITPYSHADSFFGMNHAYPWGNLLQRAKEGGLRWWRDHSVKWQTVEPQPGKFDFAAPDAQINRVLNLGMNVLVLFPFPSSNWASSAPPEIIPDLSFSGRLKRLAYRPHHLADWTRYIAQSVAHYRGRIQAYEILNEPLWTECALPARLGYQVQDYVTLLRAAYQAAKQADPNCQIIGGLSGEPGTYTQEFIEAGGLEGIDILNLHIYPGLTEPEAYEGPMEKLRSLMETKDARKPIWITECAYYADDDLPVTPFPHWMTLVESEQQCAELMVKWAAVMLSHGVGKIFYHAGGTCGALNSESVEGIFFEYGGAPRKMYTVQAALAHLLPPRTQPRGKLRLDEAVKAYLFQTPDRFVLIAWKSPDVDPLLLSNEGAFQVWDIEGNQVTGSLVLMTDTPIFLVNIRSMSQEEVGERFSKMLLSLR